MKARQDFTVRAAAGKGRCRITAEARAIGEDLVVSIWGGSKPHIGSVVIAVPRTSLRRSLMTSSTCSCFNFPGHKDELVARMIAEKIAASKNKNTVVTAGVHIDNIKRAEIRKIIKNTDSLCLILLNKLAGKH